MHAWRRIMARYLVVASLPALMGAQPPLAAILAEAGSYTIHYEESFAVIISDERYTQRATGRLYRAARDRSIESEMMFLWLASEKSWLAVRNVLTVDGAAVTNSQERLDRLINKEAPPIGVTRLRQMRNEGARFNIGSIRRNFNDPMFPLRVLEPENQRRFKFSLAGRENLGRGGPSASKVEFEEDARPTLIQDNGRDRPSRGMVWLGERGSVLRTRLEVGDRQRGLTATIVVDYRRDSFLDMLVPAAMHEVYMGITTNDTSGPLGAVSERIDCEATYSNFRRFETTARIVPGQ